MPKALLHMWDGEVVRFDISGSTILFADGVPGRTHCLGTRLAKVELKLVTAMFLLGFRHTTVDKMNQLYEPTPNWNDLLLCRPPPEQTAYLRFERSDVLL